MNTLKTVVGEVSGVARVRMFAYCCRCVLQAVTTALAQVDREKIYQWINELSSPETRENALLELSKKRESVPDLAPMLWHSCGTIAALLQVRVLRADAVQRLRPLPWHNWCTALRAVPDALAVLGDGWWFQNSVLWGAVFVCVCILLLANRFFNSSSNWTRVYILWHFFPL